MAKRNRISAPRSYLPENHFRVVDLGVCKDLSCANYYPAISHRHAFAYFKGLASPDLIRMIEKSLKTLGYVGVAETEFLAQADFTRRYGFTV